MRWLWFLVVLPALLAVSLIVAWFGAENGPPPPDPPFAPTHPDCAVCTAAERVGVVMTPFPGRRGLP